MYRFIPKRTTKTAVYIVCALLISSVILLGTPSAFPTMSFGGISQTLGFASAAVAVLLLTRYFTKEFIYEISERADGGLDFSVIECQARRQITICRISLSGIEEVLTLDSTNREKLKKKSSGRKIYSYFADIAPKNQCYIFATECGEKLLIKISPDKTLLEILQNASGS